MIAIEADATNSNPLLAKSKTVLITCYNSPRSLTMAGLGKAFNSLREVAKSNLLFSGVRLKKLNITNAFHYHLVIL